MDCQLIAVSLLQLAAGGEFLKYCRLGDTPRRIDSILHFTRRRNESKSDDLQQHITL